MAIGAGLAVGTPIGGYALADYHGSQQEEKRKKLRQCERELNDCGDVVKGCGNMLRKSEEEPSLGFSFCSQSQQYQAQIFSHKKNAQVVLHRWY